MSGRIFCSECGAPNNRESVICENCGTKLTRPPERLEPIKKTKVRKPILIAVTVVILICFGVVAAFAGLGGGMSAKSILKKTAALQSGVIQISMEARGDYDIDRRNAEVQFRQEKNGNCTVLASFENENIYIDVRDGWLTMASNYDESRYNIGKDEGIDAKKLRSDLIDFAVDSLEARPLQEGIIEGVKTSKENGVTYISGAIDDELGLIGWFFDCVDMERLKKTILSNMAEDGKNREYVERDLNYMADSWDDTYWDIRDLLRSSELIDLDTDFLIGVDKKGCLDSGELDAVVLYDDWGDEEETIVTLKLAIDRKNENFKIQNPYENNR